MIISSDNVRNDRRFLALAAKRGWIIREDGRIVCDANRHPGRYWLATADLTHCEIECPDGVEFDYIVSIQEGMTPFGHAPSLREAKTIAYQASRLGYSPAIILTTR